MINTRLHVWICSSKSSTPLTLLEGKGGEEGRKGEKREEEEGRMGYILQREVMELPCKDY